jgi:phospholipase C
MYVNKVGTKNQPDYSIPELPVPEMPITDSDGQILGLYNALCAVEWTGSCSGSEYISGIPYGNQTADNSLQYEDGFKGMRGYANEGHYVVMESNGYALYNPADGSKQFRATPATKDHESIHQRFVFHALTPEGSSFNVSSAVDGLWISQHSSMSISVTGAEIYNIKYVGGNQYTMQKENGDYLNIDTNGQLSFDSTPIPYKFWSVTYHS